MTQDYATPIPTPGRSSAFLAYVFFLLSIPSAAMFAIFGVIVSYLARDTAIGHAREHIEFQIDLWWKAFWWNVGLGAAALVSALLTVILIGFPLLVLIGLAWTIVMLWFTVRSGLGLLRLLDGLGP